jgi:hypothetical protein
MLISIFSISVVIFIVITVFSISQIIKISSLYKLISRRKKVIFLSLIILNLVYVIPTIIACIETINPSPGSQGWGWVLVPFYILISSVCVITTVPLMQNLTEIESSSSNKIKLGTKIRIGVTFLLICLVILYLVNLVYIFLPREGVTTVWHD